MLTIAEQIKNAKVINSVTMATVKINAIKSTAQLDPIVIMDNVELM